MRLLEVNLYELYSFAEHNPPPYAILSHTWGSDEVLYEDLRYDCNHAVHRSAWRKLEKAVERAKSDGLRWLWVDTCCIDKASSAELQEAINSMFRWYENAVVCYAYLEDVNESSVHDNDPLDTQFGRSRWFQRGWTLQELIAPAVVKLFNAEWQCLGNKEDLAEALSAVTGIELAIIVKHASVSTASIAKRISWAAKRRTSRVEDQAYCLLGLLGVSIPMLYGEGVRAFVRLQEEIIRASNDQSIFAWGLNHVAQIGRRAGSLLADSPTDFEGCGSIIPWGTAGEYEMTNFGLRMRAPIVMTKAYFDHDQTCKEYLAILNCRFEDDFGGTIALRLQKQKDDGRYAVSESTAPEAFRAARRDATDTVPDAARSAQDLLKYPIVRTEARLSGRLAFIGVDSLGRRDKSLLSIARFPTPTGTCPSFSLQITHSHYPETKRIEITQRHPTNLWSSHANVMLGSSNGLAGKPSAGSVRLWSHLSGRYYSLSFNAHWITSRPQDGSSGQRLLVPSVMLYAHGRTADPEESLRTVTFQPCAHAVGHCIHLTKEGRCAVSSLANDVECTTNNITERLSASIQEVTIMEEKLLVVNVHAEVIANRQSRAEAESLLTAAASRQSIIMRPRKLVDDPLASSSDDPQGAESAAKASRHPSPLSVV